MSLISEYKEWLNQDDMKEQLLNLSKDELDDCFFKELEFGTGGIRALMGPGPNRLNTYTIRKNAEGYARFVKIYQEKSKCKGVVIAYDNRKNSQEFALESAKILASHNIKVYIFSSLRPTPELSFAIRKLNAFGGIVITASHNPPKYNGYKIYDQYGCQCVPRETDIIIKYIQQVGPALSVSKQNYDKNLIIFIDEVVDKAYYQALNTVQENPSLKKDNFRIVYTPLCGTGNIPIRTVLKTLGYTVYPVLEQCYPDESFSTVDSPNPENKVAFCKAQELAQLVNADLIIATDPDCDRLGIAVKHNGRYEYLTGNQTGAILLQYILSEKKRKNTLPSNGIVFNSIVTSNLGTLICNHYHVEVESTLTGFKFIGDKIREYEGKKTFLFGYEESYGYLIKDFCRDKDGVQSSILIAEICNFYKQQNKTLIDVLHELYDKYGYVEDSQESISYPGVSGYKKIQDIMNHFRYHKINEIEGKKVIAKEDYQLSLKYDGLGVTHLNLPKSNVIKLILEDQSWIAIRPSGNEPKIKYYKNIWRKID